MKKVVVLTGAGISAESGLRTFRDSDGLWEGYDVQKVATPSGWAANPELVLRFYNERRRDVRKSNPNAAHVALAALEKKFQVDIITQNIDDLHERAGSSRVLHLHGEIVKSRGVDDTTTLFPVDGDILLGHLSPSGAQLRPHVVWFGELVPELENAAKITSAADIFMVVGTSLQVYPAAGLVNEAPHNAELYLIDRAPPSDARFRRGVNITTAPASEGVPALVERLLAGQ